MKTKIKLLLICIIFLAPPILFGQSSDFQFVISYKVGAVPNMYISSENLFIKDMVVDPPIKIRIKLTRKERLEIMNKVNEINFFEYPEKYYFESADSTHMMSAKQPCSQSKITVYINEKIKTITWDDCISSGKSKENKYENLQALENLIFKFIYNKRSFRMSKKPRAMYL